MRAAPKCELSECYERVAGVRPDGLSACEMHGGRRPAPLLAVAPLVRAIVGHVQDHDATIAVQTADAARLLGVAPDALDVALREAMRASGLTVLVGGLQAEIEALRAELVETRAALETLTAGVAQTSEEACADMSRAMRLALTSGSP